MIVRRTSRGFGVAPAQCANPGFFSGCNTGTDCSVGWQYYANPACRAASLAWWQSAAALPAPAVPPAPTQDQINTAIATGGSGATQLTQSLSDQAITQTQQQNQDYFNSLDTSGADCSGWWAVLTNSQCGGSPTVEYIIIAAIAGAAILLIKGMR